MKMKDKTKIKNTKAALKFINNKEKIVLKTEAAEASGKRHHPCFVVGQCW